MSFHFKTILIPDSGRELFLFLGSLMVMEEKEQLNNLEVFIGIRTGFILALLLSLKYKIKEIIDFFIIEEVEQFSFLENFTRYELINEIKIEKKLKDMILEKLGCIPTMENFYFMTGKKLITYVIDKEKRILYLDKKINVIEAVKINLNNYNLFLDNNNLFDPFILNPIYIEKELIKNALLTFSFKPNILNCKKKTEKCFLFNYYYLLLNEEIEKIKVVLNEEIKIIEGEVFHPEKEISYYLTEGIKLESNNNNNNNNNQI